MTTPDLPTGTVTFLFSDIEGSTRLLEEIGGERYAPILERHHQLVTEAAEEHRGAMIKNEGDGFFFVFRSAQDAVACAVEIQRCLAAEPWPVPQGVKVRIGVHTGEGRLGGADYVGIDVHRAARITDSGHGGQILVSEVTGLLTRHALPPGARLEDLGTHKLRDLAQEEHIYQLSIDGLPSEFPPLRTLSADKSNLPVRDVELVGRDKERQLVTEALSRSRLVTITGPGGVGKTSLALKVAEDLASDFEDGVWFVEVSRVSDEDRLAAAVARQLNITENPTQPLIDTLLTRLGRAKALLVLDGCEHLIDAVAKLTDQLLDGTIELKIMATSREWLSIREEHLVRLAPLAVPGPAAKTVAEIAGFDSVALFLDRARLAQPGFDLNEGNAQMVAELCRRLDGIPLAIVLAAARLKVLSVAQLVQRLDQQFALLAGTARDLPPHQQTLETTLDWSYDFLSGAERALFARLSVFQGGFTLEAVESVCAGGVVAKQDVVNLMGRLVETSLVMSEGSEPVRYRLLEPIAHYARMRLGDAADEFHLRHADYFRQLAEEADGHLLDRDQAEWAHRLELDRYNLRAALDWLHSTGRHPEALAMAGALRWFWVIKREVTEGTQWLEQTLSHREGSSPEVIARALNGAGLMATRRFDFSRAKEALTEARDLYRELGDRAAEARQAFQLFSLAWLSDDLEEARRLAPEAEAMNRQYGDLWGLAWTLAVWGTLDRLQGDLAQARGRITESHTFFVEHGGILDLGWSNLRLGALARDEGRYDEAAQRYSTGRDQLVIAGDSLGVAHADAGLGAMAWLAGDHEYALELFRQVLEGFSLTEEVSNNLFELKTMIQGNPSTAELQEVVEANRVRAERMADAAGPRSALAEYLYHMGKTAYRQGDLERARRTLLESFGLARAAGDMRWVAMTVGGLALVADRGGEDESAARLFGLAEWIASDEHVSAWPPRDEPGYIDRMNAIQQRLGAHEFARLTIEAEGMDLDQVPALVGVARLEKAVSGSGA